MGDSKAFQIVHELSFRGDFGWLSFRPIVVENRVRSATLDVEFYDNCAKFYTKNAQLEM